jgi:ATP-dependent Zn protease
MFIKFSDKTKKIIVKNSKEDVLDGYADDETIFLDSNDKKDRRVKVLSEYEKNNSKDNN